MSATQGLAEKLIAIADFLALDGTPERQQEANDLTDAARRLHDLEREVAELREARTSITSEMVNALDSIQRFGWFQTGMFARGSGEWIQYKDFATVRSMFEAILKLSP